MRATKILLILTLLATTLAQSRTQDSVTWQWQNPLPQGNFLHAVAGRSAAEAYAIGTDNMLLRWNGKAWTVVAPVSTAELYDLKATPDGDLVAAGGDATVLRYDGVAWTPVATDFTGDLSAIWGGANGEIVVAGRDDRRIRLHVAGQWLEIGVAPDLVSDLWGSGLNDLYAVGVGGLMQHFDGSAWTTISGFPDLFFTAVFGFAADDVYAVLEASRLYHFDGQTWALVGDTGGGHFLGGAWGGSGQDIWIVDVLGGVAHYDGSGFQFHDVGQAHLEAVWGDEAGNVLTVGSWGAVLTYDGQEWTDHRHALTQATLSGVCGVGAHDAFAVGEDNSLYHDDGDGWHVESTHGPSDYFSDVWAAAVDDIYVAGNCGLLHYDGAAWALIDDDFYWDVWGLAPDHVYAAGNGGRLLAYDGVAWDVTILDINSLQGVWGAAPDDLWAVGPAGNFFHFDGEAWATVPVPFGSMRDIWGADADAIYAVGTDGQFVHYDGQAWEPLADHEGLRSTAIGGTARDDVWAVGFGPWAHRYDGAQWHAVWMGQSTALRDIWCSSEGGLRAVGDVGTIVATAPVATAAPPSPAPDTIALHSYPNPFNPGTAVHFDLPRAGEVILTVHDVTGRRVATLVDGERDAGPVTASWNGRDEQGRPMPSGIYLAWLTTVDSRAVAKLTLVK